MGTTPSGATIKVMQLQGNRVTDNILLACAEDLRR